MPTTKGNEPIYKEGDRTYKYITGTHGRTGRRKYGTIIEVFRFGKQYKKRRDGSPGARHHLYSWLEDGHSRAEKVQQSQLKKLIPEEDPNGTRRNT